VPLKLYSGLKSLKTWETPESRYIVIGKRLQLNESLRNEAGYQRIALKCL